MGPFAFIRCDSSRIIGSGHVSRCLSLAKSLSKKGVRVHFLCRDLPGHINERIIDSGFSVLTIPTFQGDDDYAISQEQDAKNVLAIIKSFGKHAIVIADHYALTHQWQLSVRTHFPLVVIDDLADRRHDCDILINQNFYPEGLDLYGGLVNNDTKLLIGPSYAILSPEYERNRTEHLIFRNDVGRIVIFFGASDLSNVTYRALDAALKASPDSAKIDVVIGKNYPAIDELESLARRSARVKIYNYVENFSDFISNADVMIGAGGVTQWERCCFGIVGVVISIVDNQVRISQNLADIDASVYVGWHKDVEVSDIEGAIQTLLSNRDYRHKISKKAFSLVDGGGAGRVADEVSALLISFEFAAYKDAALLYEWRNSPIVRQMSHDPSEISFADHCSWLQQSLHNANRDILIAYLGEKPLGVLRFDYEGELAVISIYLAPHFIGQGWGSGLLKSGASWLLTNKPFAKKVRAFVKEENVRSQKAFLRSGYTDMGAYYEINLLSRGEKDE